MTNWLEFPASRRLACSRCGAEFTCNAAGPCWCAEEIARLPMPVDGEDCLCRDCLRKAAGLAANAAGVVSSSQLHPVQDTMQPMHRRYTGNPGDLRAMPSKASSGRSRRA